MATANENPAVPLAEAKYSADQLRAMLAKGHAIRNDNGDPSYPIGDTEDLDKAIRAVGRGGTGHDTIRAYIIRRAKALGASDKIPDAWSKSGSSSGASEAAITESTTLAEATRGQQPSGRRMRIKLIDTGWGSSGYYTPKVLQEAAANGVFPAGTHMYLDHPTVTERMDRPERSVRDLAAVSTTPATYSDGALYAEAQVFGPFQQLLAEQRDAIGVSIRAAGTAEQGEAEGRTGPIIKSLTEGISVDFVTKAGRGGQIVEVLEAARTQLAEGGTVGAWLESRIHLAFTEMADNMYGRGGLTRPERIALSSAISDALTAFTDAIEKNAAQLYDRDVFDDPPAPVDDLDGDGESHRPPVGAPPPGHHPLNEGTNMSGTNTGAPEGGGTTKPADIAEAEARVTALEQKLAEARAQLERRSDHAVRAEEALREAAKLRQENQRFRALESARSTVAAALAESGLPETAWPRVTATVVGHEGTALPLTEAGVIDDAKLKGAIDTAIKAEKSYVAGLLESAGAGTVRGLGAGTSGKGSELSESDLETGLSDVFESIGLPSEVAKLAAKGR